MTEVTGEMIVAIAAVSGVILGWILRVEYEEVKSVFKRRTKQTKQR